MRIIISPAKQMREDWDTLAPEGLPHFLEEARQIKAALDRLSPGQLQALWRCGDAIARQNVERLAHMDLERGLTPAILAYRGIQYQYMAPGVFTREELAYVQTHLRILSGFYGLLRPLDGVVSYRLEMQADLAPEGKGDLYAFWGDKLARALSRESDLVLDLASREYSRAVEPHLPSGVRLVRCTFGQLRAGKVVEQGTACKMARGEMVRWMAGRDVTRLRELENFRELGYRFSPEHSEPDRLVFLRGEI